MIWDVDESRQKEKYILKSLESELCLCCYTGDDVLKGSIEQIYASSEWGARQLRDTVPSDLVSSNIFLALGLSTKQKNQRQADMFLRTLQVALWSWDDGSLVRGTNYLFEGLAPFLQLEIWEPQNIEDVVSKFSLLFCFMIPRWRLCRIDET